MRKIWNRPFQLVLLASLLLAAPALMAEQFDHDYHSYAGVLRSYVRPPRVDYASLVANRTGLDRAVSELDSASARGEPGWTREQRLAFWINAYNVFTLRAVVDRYPIRAGWLTRFPRNSIRQIDGVWTTRQWRAAGRVVSLDDIEHRILRPEFRDARIHFAINCASISCPRLAAEPYRAGTLDAQLDAAGRTFLAGAEGLQRTGDTIRVSSIFKWYGDDFVAQYAPIVPGQRDAKERGILGAVVKYGSAEASAHARTGTPAIRYLDYDWTLNDAAR